MKPDEDGKKKGKKKNKKKKKPEEVEPLPQTFVKVLHGYKSSMGGSEAKAKNENADAFVIIKNFAFTKR